MYAMGHGHLAGLSRSGLAGLAVASSDHSRGLPLTMLHAYRLHSALLERGGRGGGGEAAWATHDHKPSDSSPLDIPSNSS